MSKCTMYASYSDDEIVRLVEDRFFANDLIVELAQRFQAKRIELLTEKEAA